MVYESDGKVSAIYIDVEEKYSHCSLSWKYQKPNKTC